MSFYEFLEFCIKLNSLVSDDLKDEIYFALFKIARTMITNSNKCLVQCWHSTRLGSTKIKSTSYRPQSTRPLSTIDLIRPDPTRLDLAEKSTRPNHKPDSTRPKSTYDLSRPNRTRPSTRVDPTKSTMRNPKITVMNPQDLYLRLFKAPGLKKW